MCFLLADAILCLGVRFNLMDIVGDGGEQVKLRTAAGTTCVEQTVSSVLGSRFLSGLSRIAFNLNAAGTARVEGLLSTASSREARELQFFSINGRPVDLPKVSRVLGEAWRTLEGGNLHNNKKRPACVLQFTLPPNSFDVNLSPDKRQVLLINEESFCQIVQGAVTQFWSNQLDGKFTVQNGTDSVSAAETVVPSEFVPKARRRMAFVHDFRTARLQHEGGDAHLQGQKINHTTHESQAPRTTETKTRRSSPEKERLSTDSEKRQWAQVQQRFQTKGSTQQEEIQALETADPKASTASSSSAPTRTTASTAVVSDDSTSTSSQTSSKKSLTLEDFAFTPISQEPKTPPGPTLDRYSRRRRLQKRSEPAEQEASKGANKRSHEATETDTSDMESPEKRARALMRTACENESNQQEEPPPPAQDEASQEIEKKTIVWKSFQGTGAVMQAARDARLDLQDRRKRLKSMQNERNHGEGGTGVKTVNGDNQSKVVSLTKKDFKEMEIIGQFNLGFILARCKNNHLWILDQHACDEKYNFERLCATTIIHEQKLIAPMPLELSPSEEDCILENMEIFEANGFRFAHDDTKPPRHRLALTALPHSGARDGRKAVQFGKDDVSALCAILGADGASYPQSGGTGVDGTGQYANNAVRRYAGSLSQNGQKVIARLPKAIAMFANRACRGSIMIGKALSQKEMEGIVERLGQVEHPWNCPHGRPTMRHVRDMLPVLADDGKRAEQHIAGPTVTVVPATQREEQEDE